MKYSEEANRLWPYLLPYVQRALRSNLGSSGGGGGGIGGSPSPHDLGSTHHSGTLLNGQAPQFLLRDGTRSLTGHLEVASGITIDGVDLSAHVANPDAHHDRATAGNDGILMSGQAVLLRLAADPGLELSSGVRLKAGQGIGRDSTGTFIKRASPDSGLAFDVSGALQLGTPLTITPTSTNVVSGVGHNHSVDSSSDVGTTPASKVLHSTAAGGLTLGTLTVRGSLDVVNGGDLTVGSDVLFVDVSQESVGILRAPDPQFALDVNGPIRGTELVGKHAIQLEDVALLLHFDGGEPYETNYTGEVNAVPLGQVPTTNSGAIFRPGKFYKAVSLGLTRTNLCTNPSFETNTTGWTVAAGTGSDIALTRASDDSYFGSYSAKLTYTVNNGSVFYMPTAVASATFGHYSLGAWLRAAVPTTVNMVIYRGNSPFTTYASKLCSVTEDWQYFSTFPVTSPVVGEPVRIGFFFQDEVDNSIWIDGVQLEQADFPSWYLDGSLGPNHSWNGTAHASTSTRTNSRLIYTLTNMVNHRWTVMGWFRQPYQQMVNTPQNYMLGLEFDTTEYLRMVTASSSLRAVASASVGADTLILDADNVTADSWHHFAFVYTPGSLKSYIDGVLVDSGTPTYSGIPTQIWLGAVEAGPTYGTVMFDDICVSRQALSTERVQAIYASDAPVFAESSVFSFRATPKGLVWADEEGLWMRDVNGDPVMGFYGGEAASKSWGGKNLEQGDILFGRYGASNGGWLHFDRDGISSNPFLSLGYADKDVIRFDSGGASLYGVLDIDTAGGIYQGTGTFASPTTGLKVWNDGGIGRIGGYNSGTAQWYADTSGRLRAGGGSIAIDRNGATIFADSARHSDWTTFDPAYGYTFRASDGASAFGWLGGAIGSNIYDVTLQSLAPFAGNNTKTAELNIRADAADVAWGAGTAPPQIRLRAGGASMVSKLYLNAVDLELGTAFTRSGAALGAYQGKLRVNIAGTNYWIPYYA